MPRGTLGRWLVIVVVLIIPGMSRASRPVRWSSEACVVEGMLFSLRESAEGTQVHRIRPTVDLDAYEGKRLRVHGMLSPGDRLDLEVPQGVEVLGECDARSRSAIAPQLAWAYEELAKQRLAEGNLTDALREIDRAIASGQSVCVFHLTRAVIQDRRGMLAEAGNSAAFAVACLDRYPDLDLAGGVLERAGRRAEALAAYRKAASICGYPPDRAKIEAKIERLR